MNKYFIFTAPHSHLHILLVVGSQRGHFLPRIFMHSYKKFFNHEIPATCKFLLNFNYEEASYICILYYKICKFELFCKGHKP